MRLQPSLVTQAQLKALQLNRALTRQSRAPQRRIVPSPARAAEAGDQKMAGSR